jgi:hypothetical protein
MSVRSVSVVALVALGACGLASACGDTIIIIQGGPDGSAAGVDSSTVTPGADAETSGDGAANPDSAPLVVCPAGSETRISGIVYDPAGRTPLYNVRVFIPSGPLPPIPTGVPVPDPATNRCAAGRTCESEAVNPIVATLSDSKGRFELNGPKVLPGRNVPLVIQVGKWRRAIVIPEVKACENTKLDRADTRLPKNGAEGDMPQIAVTTGGCDALECLLGGIGIDLTEFEAGSVDPRKHVHMYRGEGGAPTLNGAGIPAATELWSNVDTLRKQDITMLSCECSESNTTKPAGFDTIRNYADAGGRVFFTHFHATWLKNNATWGTGILDFTSTGAGANPYEINTTFPKGLALSEWLVEVGASPVAGQIDMPSGTVTNSQQGLAAGSAAKEWIGRGATAKHFSFNTPYKAPLTDQCGRVMFSDVHSVTAGGGQFPSACGAFNRAQVALEYMFFDLSSCVQDESLAPVPPK